MIWVIRLYLLIMAFIYALIGVWALLDPLLGALDQGYPSFLNAVGLSITSPLGYSEIAGIYGGLNLCIGILCLIGIFKRDLGIFAIKFITFLVGSIALGRILSVSVDGYPDHIFLGYTLIEVVSAITGILLIKHFKH